MNVLAFDTCFGAVSVAVRCRDAAGQAVAKDAYEARTSGHAERLMPMIDETMRAAGLKFADVDRIGVTVGPGAFTGVRVGIAAARALALATGKPVVGMTSLAVMEAEARRALGDAKPIAVAIDARGGMVYFALFASDRETSRLLEPVDAAALVGNQPVILVGSGGGVVAQAIAAAGGEVEVALPELQPHARSLAEQVGSLFPAGAVRPLYLRRPDARYQGDKSLPRVMS
jgi:tRNA threonylcarbamoyladenosine biosynthesis protein TsaB